MIIDHVGIVVRSLDEAIEHWRTVFGYQQQTRVVDNIEQKARVVFLAREGSLPIKLVEPTDPTSPVQALARRGGGLHHLCFRCESVDAEVARLEALGLRILDRPQSGEAFDGEAIAFIYTGGGLTIELIDTAKRTGMLADGPTG